MGIFLGDCQADGDAGRGAFDIVQFPEIMEGGCFFEAVHFEAEGGSNFIVLILADKKEEDILFVLVLAEQVVILVEPFQCVFVSFFLILFSLFVLGRFSLFVVLSGHLRLMGFVDLVLVYGVIPSAVFDGLF